jgi:hypothetical protein
VTRVKWREIAQGVAVMQYPLRAFGIDFHRCVTLLRLTDGRVVIHSSAPFTAEDVEAIRLLGKPSWQVEATLMHDTFARAAHTVFPDIPYLAPDGFAKLSGVPTQPLNPLPPEWAGEIEVLRVEGLRKINEHAFFHRASRTLVLADLLFHFPADARGWSRFFAQRIMRLPRLFGISAFFRLMIRDQEAFARSLKKVLEWDFEQIVVGHGEPMQENAKTIFAQSLRGRGIAIDS